MSMLGKEMAALRPLGSTVLCDLHHLIRKQLLILKLQFFSTMKVATIDILQLLRYCYVVIVGWYSYTHKSLFTQWSSALQQNSDPLSSGLTGVLDVYSTVQTSNRAHAKRSTPVILICVLLKKRNYTKFCVLLPNFELECFFPKELKKFVEIEGRCEIISHSCVVLTVTSNRVHRAMHVFSNIYPMKYMITFGIYKLYLLNL